jgi:hypothetical protein
MSDAFVDVKALKRKIAGMSGSELREAMQNSEFVRQCEVAGIPVLRGSWEEIRDRGTADSYKSSKP